jgi:serine/threonine protein phosphatase PrpC
MWRFAAAQTTGTSHLRAGLPCQDRLACAALPGGALVAALADGAGSAAEGGLGAEIAVEAVVRQVRFSLEEGLVDFDAVLKKAAAQARAAVLAEALRQDLEPRSLASTLLALVLTPDGGGALQIGDGVIVVGDTGDEWSWVFWPQRGEYANTTFFLTDDEALGRVQIETLPATITGAALMSDGLEPLALHYASTTVHQPFFQGMFRPLIQAAGEGEIDPLSSSLEQFLLSDRVSSRTDDDLSLILATRRNPVDPA